MNSIPLISCMYTDISMRLYFKMDNKTIIKSFYSPVLIGPVQGQVSEVSILLDYIYVEKDERARLSKGTIDNLITIHKNYTSSKNVGLGRGPCLGLGLGSGLVRIRHDFSLTNLVKEIFWTNKFIIKGPLGAKSTFIDITDKVKILSTLIYFNDARRDGINPVNEETINPTFQESINPDYNMITTTINQYKYNTRAYGPKDVKGRGYNAYSFAFKPEDFQPSGAVNMSQINTFSIELVIDPVNLDPLYITSEAFSSTLSLYTIGYNFMRMQGGIGAVLYTV